ASSLTWTWSSDRKSVTIGRGYNFTPGDYSVTVSSSVKEFKIENEKLIEISIGATNIYPQSGAQDLNVSFYNQYGQPMNPYLMNLLTSATVEGKSNITLTFARTTSSLTLSGAENLEVGDLVKLMIADNATIEVATKTVEVTAAPTISSFTFGELAIANDATKILTGTHGHKITVYAMDQYGNPYKLRIANQDISATISAAIPLLIRSTDNTIIDPSLIEVDADGKLFFKPGAIGAKGGQVTLTVISPFNSDVMPTATYTLTVYEPQTISSISVQGLAAGLRAGSWTPLIAFVYDQYGVLLPMESINNATNLAKLTMISTNPTAIPLGNAATATGIRYNSVTKVIEIYGAAAGTTTVIISYNNVPQSTMVLNVEASASPAQMTNVNIPSVFQKTAYADLTLDDFTIYDQYGLAIDLLPDYTISVTGAATLSISNDTLTTSSGTTRITTPNTTGNYDIVFALKDPNGNTLATQSKVIEVVDAGGITSYQIESISNIYSKIS
ncbi:MAG: hypothetical protein GX585_05830, partial [Clostridiales bacterium]|nr:hypothetical protein [Clostridiales bacterium]